MEKTIYIDDRFSIKVLPNETGEMIETMLYDSANDCTHFLNSTAIKIFELAFEGKNKEGIEKAMRKHFNIEDDVEINGDIEKTLLLFRENKLIG